MMRVHVRAELARAGTVLAPVGTATPHDAVTALAVAGGTVTRVLWDGALEQAACVIDAGPGILDLDYAIAAPDPGQPYPEAAFRPRATRYTQPDAALAMASRDLAAAAGGGLAGLAALVAEAEARFQYGHPDVRFNDDTDAVPYLSCGLTEGSCVDINTYLVASLRAAGYEAAYIYGYFFPAERGGITNDSHCWVVTRHDGALLEWDIAHHMKAGLGATRPGLNPRPGTRVALGHSMGHRYGYGGAAVTLKLLAEPMLWDQATGRIADLPLTVALA